MVEFLYWSYLFCGGVSLFSNAAAHNILRTADQSKLSLQFGPEPGDGSKISSIPCLRAVSLSCLLVARRHATPLFVLGSRQTGTTTLDSNIKQPVKCMDCSDSMPRCLCEDTVFYMYAYICYFTAISCRIVF